MNLFTRLSLSSRLILLAIALLVPVAVLVVFAHLDERDDRRREGIEEARNYTRTSSAALESFATDVDGYLAGASEHFTNETTINNETAAPYLSRLIKRYPNASSLFITDPNGRVIAQHTGDDTGFDLATRPYVLALKGGAKSVWSGALSGLRTGELTAVYARVIEDSGGSPKAFLILSLRPSNLGDSEGIRSLPADANFLLVDSEGKVVINLRDPDFQRSPKDLSGSAIIQDALKGQFVTFENTETEFDEGRRYGAAAAAPHMGWLFVYTRSQALLDSELQSSLLRDLGIMAGVLAAAVVILVIAGRQMSRPIARLSEAATDMAAGKRVSVPVTNADPDITKLEAAFGAMSSAVAEREDQLREQARVLTTLEQIGAWLASDLDYEKTLQAVTDAGTRVTEAEAGAFYYSVINREGETDLRNALSGPNPDALSRLSWSASSPIFGPVFRGEGPVRLNDLSARSDGSHGEALIGDTASAIRSCLAVPVTTASGNVIGGLVFGHSQPSKFTERHEKLATGIASWGAIALDNARLYSEAQEVQEELRTANRMKDEFLGLVSHELRTPTTTIYGSAKLLKEHPELLLKDDASAGELVEAMAEEAGRLVRLIENLLAFARVELGREMELQTVATNETVQRFAQNYAKTQLHRAINLELADDTGAVLAEIAYFEQVLLNLLSNATKYSPDDRPITVQTKRVGDDVQVSVLDEGPGVAPEETERIFESFYRSQGTSNLAGGHGLGLTVCKRLIEAQGGRIWAANRPGGGLEVAFALPAAPVEAPEPRAEAVAQ